MAPAGEYWPAGHSLGQATVADGCFPKHPVVTHESGQGGAGLGLGVVPAVRGAQVLEPAEEVN